MFQKIKAIEQLNFIDFIDFNKKCFPDRKNLEKQFLWQYTDNPIAKQEKELSVLLYCDEKGSIIGQFLLNPFTLYDSCELKQSYWGMDFFVSKNSRGPCGAILARNAIGKHSPYFTIGPSEAAKKLSLALGAKIIGKMKIFIWFKNPLDILKYKIIKNQERKRKSLNIKYFPKSKTVVGYKFNLVEELDNFNDYCWGNTIQTARTIEFLKWRFFNKLNKYYFYLSSSSKSPIYFVVRKCILNGFTFLSLVDYKIPAGDSKSWVAIIKTSKKIAKITGCDGMITMVSHRFFDKELFKNFFFYYGGHKEIVSNIEIDDFDGRIIDRKCIYATMADCDVDLCVDN